MTSEVAEATLGVEEASLEILAKRETGEQEEVEMQTTLTAVKETQKIPAKKKTIAQIEEVVEAPLEVAEETLEEVEVEEEALEETEVVEETLEEVEVVAAALEEVEVEE
ncbi:unnamed protein product, partial [Darwinula stevensoni]